MKKPHSKGFEMNGKTGSVVFASSMGALVGGATALEIAKRLEYGPYLAILGILLGGATAYVLIDFRRLLSGIRSAWKDVTNWQPNVSFWKETGLGVGAFLTLFVTYSTILITLEFFFTLDVLGKDSEISPRIFGFSFLGLVFSLLVLLMWDCVRTLQHTLQYTGRTDHSAKMRFFLSSSEIQEMMRQSRLQTCKQVILWANPIGIVFWTVIGIVWTITHTPGALYNSILFLGRNTPKALRNTVKFFWLSFLHVHSSLRVICFIDACVGGTVGYLNSNPLLGTLVGGAFGAISYKLVAPLVTKFRPVWQRSSVA